MTSPGRQLATVPEDAFDLRQELRDVEAQKEVAVRMQATLRMGGRAIYFRFFCVLFAAGFVFFGGVPGSMLSSSLLFLLLCFSASLIFCLSASLPVCFSAFCFSCFTASLLFAFPASLLLCFSCFSAFLLLCFSAVCFPCFTASLFSLLLCFCASVPFYFYYSTFFFL